MILFSFCCKSFSKFFFCCCSLLIFASKFFIFVFNCSICVFNSFIEINSCSYFFIFSSFNLFLSFISLFSEFNFSLVLFNSNISLFNSLLFVLNLFNSSIIFIWLLLFESFFVLFSNCFFKSRFIFCILVNSSELLFKICLNISLSFSLSFFNLVFSSFNSFTFFSKTSFSFSNVFLIESIESINDFCRTSISAIFFVFI